MVKEVSIITVKRTDEAELAEVRQLFTEYAEWLSPFVTASNISAELESLPSPFVAPHGRLLAARDSLGALCGVVGIKRHSVTEGEIKRLFVRPDCRGTGLGYTLFSAALDAACALGYREALVSTVPAYMEEANRMYERLGFANTECFEEVTQASAEITYLRYDLSQWCPTA
jgi:GNAT superfamily N-acetyltransferase